MHYVVGDVHNELRKLEDLLEQIHPSIDDRIYFLGDLFDRGADRPDDYQSSVWVNGKENVLLLDCGCGLAGGRLAAICLETGERFYSTRE